MTTTTQNAGTVVAHATSDGFKDLCEAHGIAPTRRQASKYLNGYGALVWKERRDPHALARLYAAREKAKKV
jgi:hypothetical protein